MAREILRVDFEPDEAPSFRRRAGDDLFWSVIGALVIVAAVALFIKLLPFLVAVLAAAALLAALSTWKAARRRELRRRHGWPAEPVRVKTYLGYTAAWFVGLLALVPVLLVGAVFAIAALVIVGLALVAALLTSLFRID